MTSKIEDPPAKKAPWPPLAENDQFFRYPKLYPLKNGNRENLASIAKDNAVDPGDFVFYNFRTRKPKEINWYLANYIGCTKLSPSKLDYSFEGVVPDEKANKGVVFIPMFGESTLDYANRVGQRVVENYNKSTRKEPGGKCHRTCYARVEEAVRQVGGAPLPKIDWTDPKQLEDPFVVLWSSRTSAKSWSTLPLQYRGKGAAGAMAYKGLATLVEGADFWAGKLKPGAVIQAWVDAADFTSVRDGGEAPSGGHSFIFLNYVRKNGAITGIAIADQGYQNGQPLEQADYGFWVGANINAPPPAKP